MLSASAYIPITLRSSGKAYRTPLLGQVLTSCGTIPAPRSHELAGKKSCYIFVDDFHLLTDRRVYTFLCMLANRLPANVHLIWRSLMRQFYESSLTASKCTTQTRNPRWGKSLLCITSSVRLTLHGLSKKPAIQLKNRKRRHSRKAKPSFVLMF